MPQTRKLSQEGFGSRVGVSAMAASRWERGVAEPTGETYIRLGNLADSPLCWFFWKRAGLRLSAVTRVLPEANRRFAENRIFDVQVVKAGSTKKQSLAQVDLGAIPLLPVHAGTPGAQGDTFVLTDISAESVLAAPQDWCPNPDSTVCLRVKGNSMSPLILDGYIIAVDTSDVYRDDLLGQIVVAWNIEKGLLVSRLARFDHTDVLLSDHPECASFLPAAESRWRIVG